MSAEVGLLPFLASIPLLTARYWRKKARGKMTRILPAEPQNMVSNFCLSHHASEAAPLDPPSSFLVEC